MSTQLLCDSDSRRWNSPTTLYIARRIIQRSNEKGRSLSVLDLGCGDGSILAQLAPYGQVLYGYDLTPIVETAKQRLMPIVGDGVEDRIRVAIDERSIPFPDASFDVIYANQVFEHVRFIDTMLRECTRVLKPDGLLLALFPLATYPVEWHLKVPFAHWIPPGTARIRYLRAFYATGIRPKLPSSSSLTTAVSQDDYLRNRTYYRFMNEVESLGRHYFHSLSLETGGVIRAKRDLLTASERPSNRWLGALLRRMEGPALEYLVTHYYNAAFCMSHPRK